MRDPEDVCRVRNVRAISEDELLELYAARGRIPPLPPTGPGELQVENPGPATATAAGSSPEGQPDESVAPELVTPSTP